MDVEYLSKGNNMHTKGITITDIREFTNNQADSLKVKVININGIRYLDIRRYYRDNGQYKPTRKGVAISEQDFEFLFKTLKDHQGSIRKTLRGE